MSPLLYLVVLALLVFSVVPVFKLFFSSRRRHTRFIGDWSSDVCSSDLMTARAHIKFGMIDNLAYAAGDFGCNMSFALKGTLVIFWTQFMQMDSILYAGLLLLVKIWDAR